MKIDTTKNPYIPYDDWTVEYHDTSLGKIDPTKIELYLDEGQKDGKWIVGNELRKKLEGKPVLNANVLDYLYKHQDLIPEDWKSKFVYFWGTIYRDADGDLYVRCLYFEDGVWDRDCRWLGRGWRDYGPASLLASIGTKPLKSKNSFDSLSLEARIKELEDFKSKVEKVLKL